MPSPPSSPSLTAIVAATMSNGIGKNGALPWRLPGEMKYFAKVTTGSPTSTTLDRPNLNAVIMGRKTWESIPPKFRPLKDRINLVISRAGVDVSTSPKTTTHTSLPSALSSLDPSITPRAFLIGGAQLYTQALTSHPPLVDRVLLTRVLEDFECDTFLDDFTAATTTTITSSTSPTSTSGLGQADGVARAEISRPLWEKRTHEELCEWVGFHVDEENEEKGVKYRYEMWTLVK